MSPDSAFWVSKAGCAVQVYGFWCMINGIRFMVEVSSFSSQGSGFSVSVVVFRDQCFGFWVSGLRFSDQG